MFSYLRSAVLVAHLLSLTRTVAAFGVETPSTIFADEDTKIDVNLDMPEDLYSPSDNVQLKSYSLWLGFDVEENRGSFPNCVLASGVELSNLSPTIRIPASVGESSRHYRIAMSMNEASDAGVPLVFSLDFSFDGGEAEWTTYEREALVTWYAAAIPCSSYDCTRQCTQRYFPQNKDIDNFDAAKPTVQCFLQCPGTFRAAAFDRYFEQSSAVNSTVAGQATSSAGAGAATGAVTSTSSSSSSTTPTETASTSSPTGAAVSSGSILSTSYLYLAVLMALKLA